MRYLEIIQPKKSRALAAPEIDAVNPDHPKAVKISSGTGPVRVRIKRRNAYIVNDGTVKWLPFNYR